MDLEAVWNRIDKLEQLVVHQANDIDTLRRSIEATQMAVENINQQSCLNIHNAVDALDGCSGFEKGQAIVPKAISLENKTGQQLDCCRMITQTNPATHQSYIMNPIHPANAIPPMGRPLMLANGRHDHESHREWQKNTSFCGQSNLLQQFSSLGPRSQVPIATLEGNKSRQASLANNRWSMEPSLLESVSNEPDDRSSGDQANKRKSPFSLVELITCFFPCFSLC
jgi:hypothetical protein